jgi:hypothetical protein
MEQAYVYMWTETATDMWYIGSRTKKGCHPDDGYICSSKIVKPKIKSNPDGWTRKLLYVGDAFKAFEIECFVLKEMRARQSEMSYNLHNQDMNFHGIRRVMTPEAKKRLIDAIKGKPSHRRGKKFPFVTESNKKRTGIKRPSHSEWMTGRTWECLERTCPHCGKVGKGGNMLRYHFDNCKNPQQYIFKD